jgi:DNA-binding response OmpR family regulator
MSYNYRTSDNRKIEIYYADDDDDDIELFTEAVSMIVKKGKEKITLNVYNNGELLLNKVSTITLQNSLILLDINMPKIDGIEVLRELRKSKKYESTPIVMFSTSSSNDIVMECWDNGANLYIIKPSKFTTLIELIEKVIKINWEEKKIDFDGFVFN